MKRVCLGLPGEPCARLTDKRRCAEHQRRYEAQRGSRRITGAYDTDWQRLRAQAIREHPWCAVCGHPGTPDNPLTGDHVVPRSQGGRNVRSNVQVLCRGCNSRKGAQLVVSPAVEPSPR